MRVGRRRQRRVAVRYWVVTQRVCMDRAAIVTASDIDKCTVADRKGSAGGIRQRRLYRPASRELFVDIKRDAGRVITAGGYDAGVINRSSVEPQPGGVQRWPGGPSVGTWIVDLRDGERGRETASEQVQFALVHRAARPCYCRWHRRAGRPRVTRDIVDVQRGQFVDSVVTTSYVQLAVDDPEPRQEERLRQGRERGPTITGDIVGAQRVNRTRPIETTCYVNLPIPIRGSLVG